MKLKQYLLGLKFILKTDHKPLVGIFVDKKGLPLMACARLQRWALIISHFQFTIEHIKDLPNEADSLSRNPQIGGIIRMMILIMSTLYNQTVHAN